MPGFVNTPGYFDLMPKVYSGHTFEMHTIYRPIPGVQGKTATKRVFVDKCGKAVLARY